jgi:hypothetical protein
LCGKKRAYINQCREHNITMKKLLTIGLTFTILALVFAIWPSLTAYLNTEYFDIRQFLIDYPYLFWPFDGLLWLAAIACFVIYFIFRKGSVSFIQTSLVYGNGAKALEKLLDSHLISSQVITVEDSFSSDDPLKEDVEAKLTETKVKLEQIGTRNVNYLAVAHIPLIVYAGAIVGNNGIKANYWYYRRSKRHAKKLSTLGKIKNSFTISTEKNGSSRSLLIIVQSTYKVDSVTPDDYFGEMDRIRLSAQTIGIDSIPNEKTLIHMADQVWETLARISDNYDDIHLILSASAPLCFAIGQRLNSTNMPAIWVYEYSKQSEANRPWCIQVNPNGKPSFFQKTPSK